MSHNEGQQSRRTGNSDEEIYEKIMDTHGAHKKVIIETQMGDMEFRVTEPSRATRNRVQENLPQDMFQILQDLDVDIGSATNPAEIMEQIDEDEIDLSAMTLGEDATKAWDDMVVEALKHDTLVREEIRPLVEDKFPDEVWYGIGGMAMSLRAEQGAINGFREK